MKHQNIFTSIDEVEVWILEELFSRGEYITTRELKTLELCNINFCITNPLNRNTNNPKRKWKLPLAIGEFAWHVSGSKDVDFIAYYARQWKNFSTDGKMISQSCYGHKIFKKDVYGESQWDRLIKLLKKDKFSRRAVLDLYESDSGIDYFAKDIACVSTVQFLIRKEKLDVIVNMRSNDLIWGLPYDIYLFTMLQELLSLELEIELGNYYHNVGSMHIYERHFELGREMLNERNIEINPVKMEDLAGLKVFLHYEELIRTKSISMFQIDSLMISQYWKNLLSHLIDYNRKDSQTINIGFDAIRVTNK
jgi:thymidylate synthase